MAGERQFRFLALLILSRAPVTFEMCFKSILRLAGAPRDGWHALVLKKALERPQMEEKSVS